MLFPVSLAPGAERHEGMPGPNTINCKNQTETWGLFQLENGLSIRKQLEPRVLKFVELL